MPHVSFWFLIMHIKYNCATKNNLPYLLLPKPNGEKKPFVCLFFRYRSLRIIA